MSTVALSNLMLKINTVKGLAVAETSQAKRKSQSDLTSNTVDQTTTADNNLSDDQNVTVEKQGESFKHRLDENMSIEPSRHGLESDKANAKVPDPGTAFNKGVALNTSLQQLIFKAQNPSVAAGTKIQLKIKTIDGQHVFFNYKEGRFFKVNAKLSPIEINQTAPESSGESNNQQSQSQSAVNTEQVLSTEIPEQQNVNTTTGQNTNSPDTIIPQQEAPQTPQVNQTINPEQIDEPKTTTEQLPQETEVPAQDTVTQDNPVPKMNPLDTTQEVQTSVSKDQAVVQSPVTSNENTTQQGPLFSETYDASDEKQNDNSNDNQPAQNINIKISTGHIQTQNVATSQIPTQNTAASQVQTQSASASQILTHGTAETVSAVKSSENANESEQVSQVTSPADTQTQVEVPQQSLSSAQTTGQNSSEIPADIDKLLSEQIQNFISSTVRQGEGEITVRLNPPELGKVLIKFQQEDGQLTGLLEFTRAETKVQVQQLLPQIVRNLADIGIVVKKLDVSQSQIDSFAQQSFKEQSFQQAFDQQQGFLDNQQTTSGYPADWLTANSDYVSNEPQQTYISDETIDMLV